MPASPPNPMSVPALPAVPSPGRLWLRNFHGLWLLTWKNLLAPRRLWILIPSLFVLPSLIFMTVGTGQIDHYLNWLVQFHLLLILPLSCLFTFGGMIRDELQADTLHFLLTRPLTRARLFFTKFLCQATWMEILLVVQGLTLLGVGLLRNIEGLLALAGWFLLAQGLAVLAYGSLSALLGLLHPRYLVLGLIYGFIVEIGIARIPTNINALSISHHLQTVMAQNPVVQETLHWTQEGFGLSLLVLLITPWIIAGLAALVFTWKEYLLSEDIQK